MKSHYTYRLILNCIISQYKITPRLCSILFFSLMSQHSVTKSESLGALWLWRSNVRNQGWWVWEGLRGQLIWEAVPHQRIGSWWTYGLCRSRLQGKTTKGTLGEGQGGFRLKWYAAPGLSHRAGPSRGLGGGLGTQLGSSTSSPEDELDPEPKFSNI